MNTESERLDEDEIAAGDSAGADDVAAILRDLRLIEDDFHDTQKQFFNLDRDWLSREHLHLLGIPLRELLTSVHGYYESVVVVV